VGSTAACVQVSDEFHGKLLVSERRCGKKDMIAGISTCQASTKYFRFFGKG